ncbi:hypothetical protein D9M70_230680 [compost metagenome]
MQAAGPVVAIVVGGGVVQACRRQRAPHLGLPAVAGEVARHPQVHLVTLLVVLARVDGRNGVVVEVGETPHFGGIAQVAGQHAREVAGLDVPVGILVDVLGAGAGADAVPQEERDVVAPAELRIGLQAERFEGCAQLQAGGVVEPVADEATIDGLLAVVLEPVTQVREEVVVGGLHIQAEGVEEEAAIVLGGVPVLVAVVHAQGAADIQGTLAVVAAQADMGERLGRRGDRCRWRRRAGGLVGHDGMGAKRKTNEQHVLFHQYLICKFAKAEFF